MSPGEELNRLSYNREVAYGFQVGQPPASRAIVGDLAKALGRGLAMITTITEKLKRAASGL